MFDCMCSPSACPWDWRVARDRAYVGKRCARPVSLDAGELEDEHAHVLASV